MDLDLIKNDTKTRYANEKRKQLEPMLKQITLVMDILSSVPQANELLPHVSGSFFEEKVKEAYTDGFSDSRFDFDIENYR